MGSHLATFAWAVTVTGHRSLTVLLRALIVNL
jgi:hypothetical protein